MSRIDRARMDAATFPIMVEIGTRYDDLDSQGHVNNAAAVALLQEGRVYFDRAAGLQGLPAGLGMMVVSLTVEYAAEVHHPAPVHIGTGLLAMGRSSFTVAQLLRQEGRSCIYAQAVLVMVDGNGPAPLPEAARKAYLGLAI